MFLQVSMPSVATGLLRAAIMTVVVSAFTRSIHRSSGRIGRTVMLFNSDAWRGGASRRRSWAAVDVASSTLGSRSSSSSSSSSSSGVHRVAMSSSAVGSEWDAATVRSTFVEFFEKKHGQTKV